MEEGKSKFEALRRQAQAAPAETEVELELYSPEELRLLVEELNVHQVELERQHVELQQAQQALEASRDRYAELYDLAPVGYFTIDEDGLIVEVNLTAARMLGAGRADLLGRELAHFVAAADQQTYYRCYRRLIVHQSPATCEVQLVRPGGLPFHARLQGTPRPGQDVGNQAWIVVSDVTEYKEMASALRQAHVSLEKRVAELTYTHGMLVEEAEEREHAQEKLKKRNQELALLNTVMASVSSSLELRDVAANLQKLLAGEMNIAGGAIFFYDLAQDRLVLQAQWQLPPVLAAAFESFPVSGSSLEPLIRYKKHLLWEDFRQAPLLFELELDKVRPDWCSYLCVPLLAKSDVEGALCLFSQAPASFSRANVTFFQILGQQVGIAIQNARLFHQVRNGQQRLRHLAQRVFTAQERERYRVSRELHDEAGQALTGLKITLEMINADLDRRDGGIESAEAGLIRQQLDAAVELCELTMNQIRVVAHDLRPAALENLGLDMTLQSFCRDFARRTNLDIIYKCVGSTVHQLPAAVDIALYRFLQEALNNVAKHAQASRVSVELHADKTTISLTVVDDGRGFEPEEVMQVHNQAQGIGLSGMQERLESVGGRLIISSRPGEGTHLVAWIPR